MIIFCIVVICIMDLIYENINVYKIIIIKIVYYD